MKSLLATILLGGGSVVVTAADVQPAVVPGSVQLIERLKSPSSRDQQARRYTAAWLMQNLVRINAGDRARSESFTSNEKVLLADLGDLHQWAEQSYLESLPPACAGQDCAERRAFYRCTFAYQQSPEYYRAVYDTFFPAAQQAQLTPRLSGAGTIWQQALRLAPGSQSLERLAPPSEECTGGADGISVAASSPAATAAAGSGSFAAHATALQRAHAASIDISVLGLLLGEPVRLPVCRATSLFEIGMAGHVTQTCLKQDDFVSQALQVAGQLSDQETVIPFDITIAMPKARCPDWVAQCQFSGHLVDGRLVAVAIFTTGLASQREVGNVLTQKYGKPGKSYHTVMSNDKTGDKQLALHMNWTLPGVHVTLAGYRGGPIDGYGLVLIETETVANQRNLREQIRQQNKQKF